MFPKQNWLNEIFKVNVCRYTHNSEKKNNLIKQLFDFPQFLSLVWFFMLHDGSDYVYLHKMWFGLQKNLQAVKADVYLY